MSNAKTMLCLKRPTDGAWAVAAMRDVDAVLIDHAHCEMKAASNVLSLIGRATGDPELARTLSELAREELEHFERVLAILSGRRAVLGPPAPDAYAAELRRAVHALPRDASVTPFVDRLLVCALIEARSCERFKLLREATAADAAHLELHFLWSELLSVEARHYRTFIDLAVQAANHDRARVSRRLEQWAEIEASIVGALASGAPSATNRATIHG